MNPDPGSAFHKFLTPFPDLGPKKNAESIRSRLRHSGSVERLARIERSVDASTVQPVTLACLRDLFQVQTQLLFRLPNYLEVTALF